MSFSWALPWQSWLFFSLHGEPLLLLPVADGIWAWTGRSPRDTRLPSGQGLVMHLAARLALDSHAGAVGLMTLTFSSLLCREAV